jgi:hypothetical protein
VGTKRKHNDESITVNASSEELNTATHTGAVGTQIPTMGSIVNEQQAPIIADLSTQSMADSLAANRFIDQANSIQQVAPPLRNDEGSSASSWPAVPTINSEGDSSDSGYGTAQSGNNSSSNSDTEVTGETKKRRKLEDWVIPNPVTTKLHPTMDLPGKRMKIQRENAGQQLTDRLTQHNLDLDTLVPVIEDWDITLSAYDRALLGSLESCVCTGGWCSMSCVHCGVCLSRTLLC